MSMDRRSFLKGLAAIGLIPAVDIERILAQPEAVEPSLLTDAPTSDPHGVTVEIDGYPLAVRHVSAEREYITVDVEDGSLASIPTMPPRLYLDVVADASACALYNALGNGRSRSTFTLRFGHIVQRGECFADGDYVSGDAETAPSFQFAVQMVGMLTPVPWAE